MTQSNREGQQRLSKLFLSLSVVISILAIALPLRVPLQPLMALLWVGFTAGALFTKSAVQARPYWILLSAPFAVGKTAIAVAMYLSCALNYPADCPLTTSTRIADDCCQIALDAELTMPLLARGHFLGPELRDAADQLHGDGLGEREADRALIDLVWGKIGFECFEDAAGNWVERVVMFPAGEIEHRLASQFVRGYLVGDHFFGFGYRLADRAPHALESAPHALGLQRDVVVHGLKAGLGHRL